MTHNLRMQIVLYAAIEMLPAVLLFRAELSELVSTAMRFKAKQIMPVG